MRRLIYPIILVLLGLSLSLAYAQAPEGQAYVVQAGDWLSKLAQKEYGDPLAYPAIVEATNAKATEDDSFTVITNPDLIEIGQKIWIPASAAESVDSATTAAQPTQVVTFKPTTIPTEAQTGSCFTNAIGLGREDAYRCMVENQIYDPCFAVDEAPTVVCGANPATGEIGFVLQLTEPLPAPDLGQLAMPWLVQLADGQVCGLMTGTVLGVDDRIAPYGCPDRSYLFEDFQQGEVWMAEKAVFGVNENGYFVEQSEMVPISVVWQ